MNTLFRRRITQIHIRLFDGRSKKHTRHYGFILGRICRPNHSGIVCVGGFISALERVNPTIFLISGNLIQQRQYKSQSAETAQTKE